MARRFTAGQITRALTVRDVLTRALDTTRYFGAPMDDRRVVVLRARKGYRVLLTRYPVGECMHLIDECVVSTPADAAAAANAFLEAN